MYNPKPFCRNKMETRYLYCYRLFIFSFSILLLFISLFVSGQDTVWTVKNRQLLIDDFKKTQRDVNDETSSLTLVQWRFKENDTTWSIAEVVEHMNMWNLLAQEEVRNMIRNGPQPALAKLCPSDSVIVSFIYEEKKHTSPDITIPTGKIPDKLNLELFNIYVNRLTMNIQNSSNNFKVYFKTFTNGYLRNMNQAYLVHSGHLERHLKQIRRIKKYPHYPG